MTDLYITLPNNFEELFEKYKSRFLIEKLKPLGSNAQVDSDFVITRKAQTQFLENMIAEGEKNEKLKQTIKNELKDELQKPTTGEEVKKFPHKLPRGTTWENFIIAFLATVPQG